MIFRFLKKINIRSLLFPKSPVWFQLRHAGRLYTLWIHSVVTLNHKLVIILLRSCVGAGPEFGL